MLSWQYIAGFTDGEGCIRLSQNHKWGTSPAITLAQSGDIGLTVLTAIKDWLLTQDIRSGVYSEKPVRLSKLVVYRLDIGSRASATKFLENVMPYLITKKLEAQDLLRHLKLFPALPRGGRLTWESRLRNNSLHRSTR